MRKRNRQIAITNDANLANKENLESIEAELREKAPFRNTQEELQEKIREAKKNVLELQT